jgi:hypothetical protein
MTTSVDPPVEVAEVRPDWDNGKLFGLDGLLLDETVPPSVCQRNKIILRRKEVKTYLLKWFGEETPYGAVIGEQVVASIYGEAVTLLSDADNRMIGLYERLIKCPDEEGEQMMLVVVV